MPKKDWIRPEAIKEMVKTCLALNRVISQNRPMPSASFRKPYQANSLSKDQAMAKADQAASKVSQTKALAFLNLIKPSRRINRRIISEAYRLRRPYSKTPPFRKASRKISLVCQGNRMIKRHRPHLIILSTDFI